MKEGKKEVIQKRSRGKEQEGNPTKNYCIK
jgi:hypothetical protein